MTFGKTDQRLTAAGDLPDSGGKIVFEVLYRIFSDFFFG